MSDRNYTPIRDKDVDRLLALTRGSMVFEYLERQRLERALLQLRDLRDTARLASGALARAVDKGIDE